MTVGLHKTVGSFELVGPNETLGSFDKRQLCHLSQLGQIRQIIGGGSAQPIGLNKTVGSSQPARRDNTVGLFEPVGPIETVGSSLPVWRSKTVGSFELVVAKEMAG